MNEEELMEHFDKIIEVIVNNSKDFINYSSDELIYYLKEIYLKYFLKNLKDFDDLLFIEYLECLASLLIKKGIVSIPSKLKLHEVIEQYRQKICKLYFSNIVEEFKEKVNLILELSKDGTINDSQTDEERKAIIEKVFEDKKFQNIKI